MFLTIPWILYREHIILLHVQLFFFHHSCKVVSVHFGLLRRLISWPYRVKIISCQHVSNGCCLVPCNIFGGLHLQEIQVSEAWSMFRERREIFPTGTATAGVVFLHGAQIVV